MGGVHQYPLFWRLFMSIEIKDNNYYTVHGWMINKLGLRGNALALYAIIYGFSQTDNQKCTASQSYLAKWIGCSRATVNTTLSNLEKSGFITKNSITKGNITYLEYEAIEPDDLGGCQNSLQGVGKNFTGGCQNSLHNNIDNNIDKNTLPTVEGAKPSQSIYKEIYSNDEYKPITDALKLWEKYCKNIGRGYKRETFTKWAKFLSDKSKGNTEVALAIVNQSIKKGWKDLFELKGGYKFNSTSVPFDKDKAELGNVTY